MQPILAQPLLRAERPLADIGRRFEIQSDFQPAGDQPEAIRDLVEGLRRNDRDQVLLGVTGSGKTFTVAHVIQELQRPAIVLAPNKTLAAQLYGEMRSFFPDNAVEYFVSYYDINNPKPTSPAPTPSSRKSRRLTSRSNRCPTPPPPPSSNGPMASVFATVPCFYA